MGDAPRPPEAICTRSETATPAKSQILPRSVHGLQRECAERPCPGRGGAPSLPESMERSAAIVLFRAKKRPALTCAKRQGG